MSLASRRPLSQALPLVSRRSLHHWLIMVPATTKLCILLATQRRQNYRVDACPRQHNRRYPQNSSGSVITATVVDNNGFPVKGVTVNFTSRTNSAEMTNGGQAVTNEQGKVTVTYTNTRSSIESGARPDTVEASLENGSSTLSTSINVNADASTAHLTLLQALLIQSPQATLPICILR